MGNPRRFVRGRFAAVLSLVGCFLSLGCQHDDATPLSGTWSPISVAGAPEGDGSRLPVWSGSELLVWGGLAECLPNGLCATGARYNLATNRWSPIAGAGAPSARLEQAAAWTGKAMLVWGGACGRATESCPDGATYDPAADRWAPMPAPSSMAPRQGAESASTGGEVALWGGYDPASKQFFADGALYNPSTGTWRPMAKEGAPSARRYHTMVWTGAELLLWGGYNAAFGFVGLGDGAAYDPAKDTWRSLSAVGAPQGRWSHSAVWTGSTMIVFGGSGCGDGPYRGGPAYCKGGGRYDPIADRWDSLSLADAPTARNVHSAIWTGREMIIWGGGSERCQNGDSGACADGAAYDPDADRWRPLAVPPYVGSRAGHVAVWTDKGMLVWGGAGGQAYNRLHTGLIFTPAPGP